MPTSHKGLDFRTLRDDESQLLRDKLNIGRIGWASREPDRLGPIGEAEAEYRDADRYEGKPVRCRNREAVGKIFCEEYILELV